MQPYSERQNHARRKGILRNKENVGNNHLHGGKCGFDKKPFEIVEQTKNSITFKYVSKDGEEGYPGELALTVKYTLKESELLIEYTATTDKTTLWCPTNHTYFNLDGESSGDCLDNVLQINSERITLMNDELITTGEVKYVHDGTWSIADDVILTAVWEVDKDSDNGWSNFY